MGNILNLHRIYEVFKLLYQDSYSPQDFHLNLLHKNRKLYLEGDFLVIENIKKPPIMRKVLLFDHILLMCNVRKSLYNKRTWNIHKIFPLHEYVVINKELRPYDSETKQRIYSIYFIEIFGPTIFGISFGTRGIRDLWFNITRNALKNIVDEYDKDITFTEICKITNTNVEAAYKNDYNVKRHLGAEDFTRLLTDSSNLERPPVSDPEMITQISGNALCYKNYDNRKSEIVKNRKFYLKKRRRVEKPWLYQQLFRFFQIGDQETMIFNRDEILSEDFLIYLSEGILYKKVGNITTLLKRDVYKFAYDAHFQAVIYLQRTKLYISPLNDSINILISTLISNDIYDFFYSGDSAEIYIGAVYAPSFFEEPGFNIYFMNEDGPLLRIFTYARLMLDVALADFVVANNFFLVSAKKFARIQHDTFDTIPLTNLWDKQYRFNFRFADERTSKQVIRVSNHCYLVCFLSFGYIVREDGFPVDSQLVFMWNCIPNEIAVFEHYLLVFGPNTLCISNILNGKILFFEKGIKYKLAMGTASPYVLRDGKLFRLNLPGLTLNPPNAS